MVKSPFPENRRAGYTVIELAIVIAVSGILVSIAAMRFGPALGQAKARHAAAAVAADLQYAQMVAARDRQPVIVIVNSALRLIMIRNRAGSTIYRQRFMGDDTEFALDAFAASPTNSVQIFPNGVATQTITYTATRGTNARQIRLSRAGQIRVLYP
jgi:prepilin-type N-terminal cleavage/methylation domain-containing protein